MIGLVVALAVVVGVVAAAISGGLILNDTARPASVADAVDRFQTGGAGGGKLDGVYLYATKGGESVDALGGAHHRYPATTTITAMGAPCGVKLRWDALQGRSTTWTLCSTKAGVELGTEEVVHTFFGQADDTTYACAGSELLRSGTSRAAPGAAARPGPCTVVGREDGRRRRQARERAARPHRGPDHRRRSGVGDRRLVARHRDRAPGQGRLLEPHEPQDLRRPRPLRRGRRPAAPLDSPQAASGRSRTRRCPSRARPSARAG